MAMQDTLHALADPTRREILNLLKQSRMSAGDIVKTFLYQERQSQDIFLF